MTAQNARRSSEFDLVGVPPDRKGAVWSEAVNDFFYSIDLTYPSDFANASISGVVLNDVRVASITSDAIYADRNAQQVSKDATDAYFLLLPLGGDITLTQRGSTTTARKGQFSFVSSVEPYAYRQSAVESTHMMQLPGSFVRARKPDADDFLASSHRGSGIEKIFVEFTASFCRHASTLSPEAICRIHGNVLDMLAMVLDGVDATSDETVVRMAHRRRVVRAIEGGFRDPSFSPSTVAKMLGLSPRYLQKVLALHGETVSHLLRRRRITEACRLLDRRGTSRSDIAVIAYAVGFLDPAYFSRVFRDILGMSPRDYASRPASARSLAI